MNKEGHKETLVARHPGNTNAVKFGVRSPRLITQRAQSVAEDLSESFEFSPAERVAVKEAARCIALLEAIDNDLDDRGIVDRHGKERYLLELRIRVSARLERWLSKFEGTIERQSRSDQPPTAEQIDYVRELQRIALGLDSAARTQDRLHALRQLLKLGREGTTSYHEREAIPMDPEEAEVWRKIGEAEKKNALELNEEPSRSRVTGRVDLPRSTAPPLVVPRTELVQLAFDHVGLNWRDYVRTDPALSRGTAELRNLVGDASKAKEKLGWTPSTSFERSSACSWTPISIGPRATRERARAPARRVPRETNLVEPLVDFKAGEASLVAEVRVRVV